MGLIPLRVARPIRDRAVMGARIARAAVESRGQRAAFDDVRCYCMFIGYPRSGHSLVGNIVDAHPDAVIAHELDALRYVQTGLVGRDQLFSLILHRDREFTSAGRVWTGYDYAVPGGSQGIFERLLVIGDKRGGDSTRRLRAHPELLDRLRRLVRVDVRMVHVVRNPFDNITTLHRRSGRPLARCVDEFFELCATNAGIAARDPGAVLDLRHEDLVARPDRTIRGLARFLDLEPHLDYVERCADIVFDAPKRTRTMVEWPDALVADVQRRIEGHGFLRGYSFTD